MHTTATPLESVNYLTSNYWDNGCTVSPLHAFAHLLLKSGNTQLLTVDCWDFQTRPGTTKLLKAISDGQPSGADGKGNIISPPHKQNTFRFKNGIKANVNGTDGTEKKDLPVFLSKFFDAVWTVPPLSSHYLSEIPKKWAQAMIDAGTWALR